MNGILIIAFLLFGQALSSQEIDNFVVSKSEIKNFFRESRVLLMNSQNPHISRIPTEFRLSKRFLEHIASMDSFISKTDVDFILKQVVQAKNLRWNNSLIESVTILDFNSKGIYESYTVSVPYFSSDRLTCIMNVGHITGNCGRNRLMILKRRNNKWVLYKEF